MTEKAHFPGLAGMGLGVPGGGACLAPRHGRGGDLRETLRSARGAGRRWDTLTVTISGTLRRGHQADWRVLRS